MAIVQGVGVRFPRVLVAKCQPKTFNEPKPPTALHGRRLCDTLPDMAWRNQRCFIIGGGPSLRNFDFRQLKGELTIGTNRAFERIDPCLNFSMDTRFLRWLQNGELGKDAQQKFGSMRGTKVWMLEQSPAAPFPDDVYFVEPTHCPEFSDSMEKGFGLSNNSGFGALNLAIALGASPIYLLGFDLGGGSQHADTQEWWHNGYPKRQKNDVYMKFRQRFERHAETMHKTGCRIINLCPHSALKCFEFGRFEEIDRKPERPLVISYYTKNTGYEDESRIMIASAHRMGLECDVEGIDTMGGWQKNTYFKAEFMRQKMRQYPNRPLLWLDVDVVVKQYPAIFDNMAEDFAVNIVDWAKYRAKGTQKELNTSVVFIRPNDRTHRLMDAWIAQNTGQINSGRWEQRNLQDVLSGWRHPLKVRYLPDSYCQIYDLMAANGAPVIELHQASRKLKKEVGA